MDLKSILEHITFDLVAETLGTVFFVGFLVWFFLAGGSHELLEAWSITVCG